MMTVPADALGQLVYVLEVQLLRGDEMGFSAALQYLKLGKRVAREGWNGKGMWLALQTPDEHSKMTLPYVYICTATFPQGCVPWLPSQTDLLSTDWFVVTE